ncbi:MAG: hypothetical protein HZB26_22740 [Candidatus Hydrogenedentes bacterium]|nr:hypothetical protein [Candidatus Hydrogenedentota bacterium]
MTALCVILFGLSTVLSVARAAEEKAATPEKATEEKAATPEKAAEVKAAKPEKASEEKAAKPEKTAKKDKEKAAPSGPIFYPQAPEQPRIQFLRTFSSAKDIKAKASGFKKFIVGEEEKDESITKAYGIAVKNGTIYVCDSGQNRIAAFDLKAKTLEYFGKGASSSLKKPINIAVDSEGFSYVADKGLNCVMVYDSNGQYARALGDSKKMGPTDVALLEDQLYVCDLDNAQVVIMDKKTGQEQRRIGSKGSGDGQLFQPTNIAVDGDGNVFVSDTGNSRVVRFDSRGNFVKKVGEIGITPGRFVRTKGIAVDRARRRYVVDAAFENVQLFDPEGNLLLFFGEPGNVPGGLNLPAKVIVDYDNVDLFKSNVAPGHALEYLILVSSNFGVNKVNVYGFLKEK